MLGAARVWPRETSGWSDLGLYANWAIDTGQGIEPIRDLAEYPPLAQLTLLAGGLFADPKIFAFTFLLAMALVDLAIMRMLLTGRRSSGASSGLLLWILAPALLGSLLWTRYDLLPAAFVTAAIRLRARSASRAVAVGLGIAFKLWPIVALPAAVVMSRGRRRALLVALTTAAAGFVLPAWLLNASLMSAWTHGADRGLHVEAVPASIHLLRSVAGYHAEVEFRFGAWELAGSGADGLATGVSVGMVLFVMLLALTVRMNLQGTHHPHPHVVAQLATVVLLAGMLALSKVFSPQYLVWILAPVAVVLTDNRLVRGRVIVSILIVACALTHVVYPLAYDAVLEQQPWALSLLLLRNLLVLSLALLLFTELVEAVRSPRAPRPGSTPFVAAHEEASRMTSATT